MYYSIGEIAKKLNLNASALRYYDKEGLLPFVEKTKSGIRRFKDQDMGMLNIIECLKQTGMPIKEIKKFVHYYQKGDADFTHRNAVIQQQKASVLEQMASLKENLAMLEYKAWYYEKALEIGSIYEVEHLDISEVPKEFHNFFKN